MPPKGSTRARRQAPAAAPAAAKPVEKPTAKPTKPRGRPPGSKAKAAAAPKKPLQEAKANAGAKRKADEAETEPEEKKHTGKKQKRAIAAPVAKPPAAKKPKKEKVILNHAPTTRLDVFVFGSNSNGELGLGDTFKKAECPRPRFNSILADAGIVQVSTGGMHCVALTYDNKILTWGVNDQGALGRDTQWEGGLVDMDKAQEESDEDEDDDIEVNPREAMPTIIDLSAVEPGTVFTQVAAADSASFALTDDGRVYGWGTFRVSSGL
jgi:regulator of chromosome condensation